MNISESIHPDSFADIISGFADAQRGSNQLWDFFISKFVNSKESVSINSKILVLKSLIVVDYYDKNIFDDLIKEILNKEILENSVKNFLLFL